MKNVIKKLRRLLASESGNAVAEYGVMIALIITVCMIATNTIGYGVNTAFSRTAASVANSMGS